MKPNSKVLSPSTARGIEHIRLQRKGMSLQTAKRVLVVAGMTNLEATPVVFKSNLMISTGLGNGVGTGAATAYGHEYPPLHNSFC